jgi:hypothetical protein
VHGILHTHLHIFLYEQLMRIVYEVLEDIVPMESDGSSHKEAILNSVKRFFQRAGDERFFYVCIYVQ